MTSNWSREFDRFIKSQGLLKCLVHYERNREARDVFERLSEEDKQKFIVLIDDLFGFYANFWAANAEYDIRIAVDSCKNLVVYRMKTCVRCKLNIQSPAIFTKRQYKSEIKLPHAKLCATCSAFVGEQLERCLSA